MEHFCCNGYFKIRILKRNQNHASKQLQNIEIQMKYSFFRLATIGWTGEQIGRKVKKFFRGG
jgi:hypothetical protein